MSQSPSHAGFPLAGLILLAVLSGGVWALSILEWTAPVDGWFYDHLLRLSAWQRPRQSPVFLVEVRHGQGYRDTDKLALAKRLVADGARLVVFTHPPHRSAADLYPYAITSGKVLFGRALHTDRDSGETYPEPWPTLSPPFEKGEAGGISTPPLQREEPPFGITNLPERHQATYRFHQRAFQAGENTLPALQTAILQHMGRKIAIDGSRYRINYRTTPVPLPHMGFDQVAAGHLIPELIAGRIVLVGQAGGPDQAGLNTPLGGSVGMISSLAFHGYALATLLQQTTIHDIPPWIIFFLLLLMVTINLYLYQRLSLGHTLWMTGALMLVYPLVALGLLAGLHVWLPLAELELVQLLSFILVLRHRLHSQEETQQILILDASQRLQERLSGGRDFYLGDEHWSQLVNLVTQTLELRRLIFLERVEADHRVQEIIAYNCSIDDIDEKRRDYHRSPYSTAIAEKGPLALAQRAFLQRAGDDDAEEQYLVPLSFAGDVLGFWAFGVDPAQLEDYDYFLRAVRDFGEQIAELLYQRQQWRLQRARETHPLRRYLSLEGGREHLHRLRQSMELLERRLDTLEGVFSTTDVASILYDLFGRVIQINSKMEALLREGQLPAYNMTALDLLCTLTSTSREQARQTLRFVILQRTAVNFPATLEKLPQRSFILRLYPLLLRSSGREPTAAPFQINGLLFELLDVTHLKKLWKLKESVLERLYFQLRSDLQTIELARHLLTEKNLPGEQQHNIIARMQEKIEATVEIIVNAQPYIHAELELDMVENYPVDTLTVLHNSINAYKIQSEHRRIRIETRYPELVSLAMCEPGELETLFKRVLVLLLEDAADDSVLRIEVNATRNEVWYRFTNTGFGLPADHLQAYLFGDEPLAGETFRQLRRSLRILKKWQGRLQAHSEIGCGMEFELRLKAFI